ncbi:DUF3486 family protein [Martelella mediterranea]|uniref:DUF3486 family protein n=1 Tax=Martelella mediterranea DSM 17316 TaxID=1122214 RepID=A0A1U9Z2U1_9HYPH|nr:DUF3486 family protein [Martelella mediterranea]AQZ51922.1 hypothetical protein Mame_02596 [Martelella mediterranea DSM 17316]
MAKRGRGRLSNIDLLPAECDDVVAWAAQELAMRKRTQTEIYTEFRDRLLAIQSEYEISFEIPSFTAFNRYSVNLARMTKRIQETREIAATIAQRIDAEASDELTLITAEAIKMLIYELLQATEDGGLDPKGAMQLANALRSAVQAQSVSSARRQKVEADFADKAKQAVQTVAKARGLSDEAAGEILDKLLGVNT